MGIKTKIKVIEPKTYQGKVTGHLLTLDNGVVGYLNDKESDTDLKEGNDIEYTLEVKKNKKGGDYNLLTIKLVSQDATPPGTEATETLIPPSFKKFNASKSITDMKYEGRVYCLKLAVRAFLAGKLERKEVGGTFIEWVGIMDTAIDEIKE